MINVVCSLACLVRHTHGTLRVCSAGGVVLYVLRVDLSVGRALSLTALLDCRHKNIF